MNPKTGNAPPGSGGGLVLVSTPIGNARDITLRALDVLREADVLAAEDTRALRRLLEIHGIPLGDRPCLAYHDHNGAKMRPKLLAALAEGRTVAYASEAGTPLVSDPGFDLVRAAQEAGHDVTAAPGVSAAVTALTLAGLPSDRFHFAGFLPNQKGARDRALDALAPVDATLILYESPRRVAATLAAAARRLGPERPATVARELTKRFEEVRRGTLGSLAEAYDGTTPKGEIVVLIGRGSSGNVNEEDVDRALKTALATMSVRDAADQVSSELGVSRRPVYQKAMQWKRDADDDN
ncbi:Ribosomal RNA small subunit methyltransferase I [Roseivivax jejudonensis]|uniref:Ribosomal RNA small subunit methyltransferase I n=1 Tax=Roseivivax jejudonensis TaxID=1529041 RepID=A0A1X6Y9X4_9RHOB|nr:16S rRNA (cytidine(1402)-2'-O)-methyltransferase [Roseivivax jejudonensis]SLN14679.1 Ribosomal RNA small subunit methyltransferase I [Roseivivax jejudonensis]